MVRGYLQSGRAEKRSLFPLPNLDMCAQDSVFAASFGFSSPFSPPTSLLCCMANIDQHMCTKTLHAQSILNVVCLLMLFPLTNS